MLRKVQIFPYLLQILHCLALLLGNLELNVLLLPSFTFGDFLADVLQFDIIEPVPVFAVGDGSFPGSLWLCALFLLFLITFHDFDKAIVVLAQLLLIFSERIIEETLDLMNFMQGRFVLLAFGLSQLVILRGAVRYRIWFCWSRVTAFFCWRSVKDFA